MRPGFAHVARVFVARTLHTLRARMDLCLASHRAVLKALAAFEEGELAPLALGTLRVTTAEGDLRLVDGVCFEAPRPAWVGAVLIGWLEELDDLSGVGAWWRPGLKAVLFTNDGRVTVTGEASDLAAGGVPCVGGFATCKARFLVARGEGAPPADASPKEREAAREPNRPAAGVWMSSRPAAPVHAPPRPIAPGQRRAPRSRASENDATLRARGMWRSTAVVPWDLGNGAKTPTHTAFGPLPRVVPPPRREAYSSEVLTERVH
ncbi:MAG: hypothetical protein IPK82_33940 [Polyangiaceae bacterium]|nr:hypothetical protein [Polyangiaceae bacterium]